MLHQYEPWNETPKYYLDTVIRAACARARCMMLSKYTTRRRPKAVRGLMAAGTKLVPFPQTVLDRFSSPSNRLYAEISAKNHPKFKKTTGWKAQLRNGDHAMIPAS